MPMNALGFWGVIFYDEFFFEAQVSDMEFVDHGVGPKAPQANLHGNCIDNAYMIHFQ